MSKHQRTEVQHFVPQFYLRLFTNQAKKLHCYDKCKDKSYSTSTEAIAQERFFYEIVSGKSCDFEVPFNAVENALGIIEGNWAPLHAQLISEAGEGQFRSELVLDYAPFLVLQWMRTKTYRDMIRQVMKGSLQSIADGLIELNFPEHKGKIRVSPTANAVSAMHSQRMFLESDKMSRALECHFWVVGINQTDELFYTSDHPVMRRANQRKHDYSLLGASDPGIEFAFPLDPRHILLILEKTHFSDWKEHDNRSIPLSPSRR